MNETEPPKIDRRTKKWVAWCRANPEAYATWCKANPEAHTVELTKPDRRTREAKGLPVDSNLLRRRERGAQCKTGVAVDLRKKEYAALRKPGDEAYRASLQKKEKLKATLPDTIQVPAPNGELVTMWLHRSGRYGLNKPPPLQTSEASRNNAKKAGERYQRNFDDDPTAASKLVNATAKAVLAGKGRAAFVKHSSMQVITAADRTRLWRMIKTSVEEFNKQLSDRLAELATDVTDEMKRQLAERVYKPAELNFALSVIEQARARLDGRNSIQNAQINIQVNNLNGLSKEALIAQLTNPQAAALPAPETDLVAFPVEMQEEDLV